MQAKESASNCPMLDMPGLLENQRLPKAAPVSSALKNTARVSADCKNSVSPLLQAETSIS